MRPPPDPYARARPFVVPLVALSVTLTVLVIAIVVVVVVRGRQPSGPAPAANPTTAVDPCVVGRWRVTGHREDVNVPNLGVVDFAGGADVRLHLAADGKGMYRYPEGTSYRGEAPGQTVALQVAGEVSFDFATHDGVLSFKNMRPEATVRILVNGERVGSDRPFEPSDDPVKYRCAGAAMTQTTQLYTTELARAG